MFNRETSFFFFVEKVVRVHSTSCLLSVFICGKSLLANEKISNYLFYLINGIPVMIEDPFLAKTHSFFVVI